MSFYFMYMSTWPEYFKAEVHPNGKLMGYIMGKAEGEGELWHGHVTAVTVAPEFRRRGLGRKLMYSLEETSEKVFDAYFVDLFVRVSNSLAIGMYENFGFPSGVQKRRLPTTRRPRVSTLTFLTRTGTQSIDASPGTTLQSRTPSTCEKPSRATRRRNPSYPSRIPYTPTTSSGSYLGDFTCDFQFQPWPR